MAVVVSAMTKEKIWTESSAFAIGVFNGLIGRSKPGAALLTTMVTAAGGLFGSLMASGRAADIMEGVAAGSLGALGYSIPFWFKAPEGTTSKVDVKGLRHLKTLDIKALKSGNSGGLGAEYAKEFENVQMY